MRIMGDETLPLFCLPFSCSWTPNQLKTAPHVKKSGFMSVPAYFPARGVTNALQRGVDTLLPLFCPLGLPEDNRVDQWGI